MENKPKPTIAAFDLEGTLVPEMWIEIAEQTGIEELRLTTREVSDFDELMRKRLEALRTNNVTLSQIRTLLSDIQPFAGAREFFDNIHNEELIQPVVFSNTFYQFAKGAMRSLGDPFLFCNTLVTDADDVLTDYIMQEKQNVVAAFHNLGFRIIAVGDSYNDIEMLQNADAGAFFRAPQDIAQQYPQFPVMDEYGALFEYIKENASQ